MILLHLLAVMTQLPAASGDYVSEPVVDVGPLHTTVTWVCPEPVVIYRSEEGLTGLWAPGCSFAGPDGRILLPARDIFLAVPPGSEPSLRVVPEGVSHLPFTSIARVDVSSDGIDGYGPVDPDDMPSEWGEILDSGLFRRAGYLRIRLNLVITGSGGLQAARTLRIRVEYDGAGRPGASGGLSGSIFDAFFQGGDMVWKSPPSRQGASPFWGMPWYALDVDTAGIYRIDGTQVPQAQGAVSSTLVLYCGRGRDMGDLPWEVPYSPREVPILVDDGGDGVFDQSDRLYFFGRGLAWWEPDGQSMPVHFNHRFDDSNTYWLSWGGEDGLRMDVEDGVLTGAPAMPDSFLCRYHLEENTERCRGSVSFSDDWAWIKSAGSSDSWHYFDFDAPGALGTGQMRLRLASTQGIQHRIRVLVNSQLVCDTTWSGTGFFQPEFDISGLQSGNNSISLQIVREIGSDTIYLDWFEVFPWTGAGTSDMSQVPLEWWPVYDRQKFTWAPGLDNSMVFMVSGDTLATLIDPSDTESFEFQIPSDWQARELWIASSDNVPAPSEIRYETPGRIIGTSQGAQCVYIAADQFLDDIQPLADREGALSFAASEVYQEFNGGVRDPGAIRAMVFHVIETWDPIPSDLVLVGGGTWDPRNFTTSKPSHIDIQYLGATDTVSDDEFAIVGGSSIPQIAVSRIGVTYAQDLQMVVEKSCHYRAGSGSGSWQTAVIGAADDERSPLHGSDERYHTQGVERLLTDSLPAILRPEKLYMIFYDWNSIWKKPEARSDYIDLWSQGALVSFYLGHGSFDQLADEGLLYLEDVGLLDCGPRLPVALFGSCDVGRFQNPSSECIGQQVTVSPAGGAVLCLAASDKTSGPMNESLFSMIFNHLFRREDLSVGMSVLLGKIDAGFSTNNAQYILFGDGSLPLAYPWESFDIQSDTLLSGELNTVTGTASHPGLLMVEAWESCRPDTYYTFRQSLPIGYLTIPGRFYSGTAQSVPDFSADMFVPLDSDTGRLARTQVTLLGQQGLAAASSYPSWLLRGHPLEDTTGPSIELWIDGYRNTPDPEVSGEITVRAQLSDSSGINLLGNVGRQLALYVDGTPQDVSEYFQYYRGSSTSGELCCNIGQLESGVHTLGLRAADGMLNISETEMDFSVTQGNDFGILDVFPYPNPCSEGTSINWTQTSPGTVEISIYTVAGRRVARFGNIQGEAGYNQCWWDCRDADGDEVASGAYIFMISAASVSGTGGTSQVTGVIALMRHQ